MIKMRVMRVTMIMMIEGNNNGAKGIKLTILRIIIKTTINPIRTTINAIRTIRTMRTTPISP